MEKLLAWEESVLLYLQEEVRAEEWDRVWTAITSLANGGAFWILACVGLLYPKRTREAGATALVSMGLSALGTNLLLKNVVARPRPFDAIEALDTLVAPPRDFSFPSGHTSASFACALVLAKLLPRRYGIPALVLAVLIGLSRMYVGVHYPTDVLGGIVVALAASGAALLLRKLWRERQARQSN